MQSLLTAQHHEGKSWTRLSGLILNDMKDWAEIVSNMSSENNYKSRKSDLWDIQEGLEMLC